MSMVREECALVLVLVAVYTTDRVETDPCGTAPRRQPLSTRVTKEGNESLAMVQHSRARRCGAGKCVGGGGDRIGEKGRERGKR